MSFSKESLQELKERIDLIEVLSPYVQWKKTGATFKTLCPFHEEKTPSFVVNQGDTHYHCFGCGAHGDALQFLMSHLKMGFVEAVEQLAERFQVTLERENGPVVKGPSKRELKDILSKASEFYQFYLLSTKEGHQALQYLYKRGIDLEFIRQFEIGLSPKDGHLFLKIMQEQGISLELLKEVGLHGKSRVFFTDRIMFPIQDAMGAPIGFSSRKYKEDTFGGKYINSPETLLFKKSKVLFALSYARKQMAKRKEVLIVEGQLDALRLIYQGFDWAVAGQGTAFGSEMVKEILQLGVRKVFLAFDGDTAGIQAAIKVGDLFQKEGLEVYVLTLEEGMDPDLFLREKGPKLFMDLLEAAEDYLTFLVRFSSKGRDLGSPAQKSALVQEIAERIRGWDQPIMVHESLRKLSNLTQTPEAMIAPQGPSLQIRRTSHVSFEKINPDRILEADLLRWLLLMGETLPKLLEMAKKNLELFHFRTSEARALYERYLKAAQENQPKDLLSLATDFQSSEEAHFLDEILQKKVNQERAEVLFIETVRRILEREWMQKREEIKLRIYSGKHTEEEVLSLAKEFDLLKRNRPEVKCV